MKFPKDRSYDIYDNSDLINAFKKIKAFKYSKFIKINSNSIEYYSEDVSINNIDMISFVNCMVKSLNAPNTDVYFTLRIFDTDYRYNQYILQYLINNLEHFKCRNLYINLEYIGDSFIYNIPTSIYKPFLINYIKLTILLQRYSNNSFNIELFNKNLKILRIGDNSTIGKFFNVLINKTNNTL